MIKIKRDPNGKFDINYRPITLDIALIWQILAVLISWSTNKSIGWAIVHGILGFWYLIYWVITGDNVSESGVSEMVQYYKSIFK